MQRCTYRVLEFAKSELERHGLTFAIFLRIEDLRDRFIRILYLDGWQETVGVGFEAEVAHVEDILYDFRQYARRSFTDSDEIMEEMANLSVGPLRTGIVGTVALPPFTEIDPALNDHEESQSCSQGPFLALIRSIVENSNADMDTLHRHQTADQVYRSN